MSLRGEPSAGLLRRRICWSADRALAVAEQRIASNDANGAAEAYRTALRLADFPAPATIWPIRALCRSWPLAHRFSRLSLAASQQALESGIRAVTSAEDRQNAWYNLATLLATQNDATGVERSLRNAIAWAPNWFKPHWTLAQFLELTNRHEEALAEARTAVECDGNKDPEVTGTWKKLGGKP